MLPLLCPLCRGALVLNAKTWRCAAGHCFDVAREGYLNLLPVQHKKSREPGDNAEMVKARRDFLAEGHYQPLRDAIVARLRPLNPRCVLDIGCGEGYYTGALKEIADEVIGFDIAKLAVQIAAKRMPQIQWLVASSALLPVADNSQDVVCSLFSPQPVQEMARVLKPGGVALIVTPAPDHLWTLREHLFDQVRAHEPEKFVKEFEQHFANPQSASLRVPLRLNATSLRNLLLMTPYAWRATLEKREAIAQLAELHTTAAFAVFTFEKR